MNLLKFPDSNLYSISLHLNPRSFFFGNFVPLFMDLLSAASAKIVP
jgi:hypothetical protein